MSITNQQLLNTNFGDEIEKEAAARVSVIQEMYQTGHDKIASQIANEYEELLKLAEEEAKAEEEEQEESEEEEEEKKASAELGAFIERGVFDGLQKLGSARHGDPMFYLWPYIEEKVAEAGRMAALKAFGKRLSEAASGLPGKAKDTAKTWAQEARMGVTGKMKVPKGTAKGQKMEMFEPGGRMKEEYADLLKGMGGTPRTRGQYLARTGARAGVGAGALGLGAYGLSGGKKKKK